MREVQCCKSVSVRLAHVTQQRCEGASLNMGQKQDRVPRKPLAHSLVSCQCQSARQECPTIGRRQTTVLRNWLPHERPDAIIKNG